MAEKIEIEKPVVSKELAERFEELKNDDCIYPSEVCDSDSYSRDIPESVNLNTTKFEELLTHMYVLDYEVEKPKLKYIRLNSKKLSCKNYLNLDDFDGSYTLFDKDNCSGYQTKFTQEEVDEFLKDEPADMWVVEDVED